MLYDFYLCEISVVQLLCAADFADLSLQLSRIQAWDACFLAIIENPSCCIIQCSRLAVVFGVAALLD